MKKLFFLLFLSFGYGVAQAQQDGQFTQYIFNQVYWNPAAVAIETDWISFNSLYRIQWLGYNNNFDAVDGNPSSQFFSIGVPYTFKKNSVGLGVALLNEKLGALSNLQFSVNAAYMFKFKESILSLGGRVTWYRQNLNRGILRFVNPNDPFNRSGILSDDLIDFSVGIYFNNPSIFGGVSANHISQEGFSNGDLGNYNPLVLHYAGILGIHIFLTNFIKLTPSALVKFVAPNTFSIEGNVLVDFESFYGGLNIRDLNTGGILAGVRLRSGKLRIGYSLDYTFGNNVAQKLASSSHEITASYRIAAFKKETKHIMRTPRFRKEEL